MKSESERARERKRACARASGHERERAMEESQQAFQCHWKNKLMLLIKKDSKHLML